MRWVFLLLLLCASAAPVHAQSATSLASATYGTIYRPSAVHYRVLPYGAYNIIYQRGYEAAAYRFGRILTKSAAVTDSIVGPHLAPRVRMPVVLNGYNDRSNGYVTPLPFKQEIEIPSIQGSPIPLRYSSWPAAVAPHEQVHAAHAEINAPVGVGSVVRWLGPDWARAYNLSVPNGWTEGLAVYRESMFEAGAGRLNEPLFTARFWAKMASEDPWSVTQFLESPTYTQPFDRHYLAGSFMMRHLARRNDTAWPEVFWDAAAFQNRMPFLGTGVTLWHATGDRPYVLEDSLQTVYTQAAAERLERLGPFTARTVIDGKRGLNYRRPYWLDNRTLVAYARGYDVRPGFYRIDARTGARSRINAEAITGDYAYRLSADSSALLASRYVPDPIVPTQAIADAYRLDVSTGRAQRLTNGARVFAPVDAPNGARWAIQTDGSYTQWVRITAGGVTPLTDFVNSRFQQIAPAPHSDRVAVLLNVKGDQRIYHGRVTGDRATLRPWIGFADAVIYDVAWGPAGRYLLFSSDAQRDVVNAYAFDTQTETCYRLTNVPYVAREPALSPDGQTLAYVEYRNERRVLVRQPFNIEEATPVPSVQVGKAAGLPRLRRTPLDDPPPQATVGSATDYQPLQHLAPRLIEPIVRFGEDSVVEEALNEDSFDSALGLGVGVGIAGADPLQQVAYSAESYVQNGRLWGEARVETGAWALRPRLFAYNRPFATPVQLQSSSALLTVPAVAEEFGVGAGLRLPITLQSNVYQSVLNLGVDAEYSGVRLRDVDEPPFVQLRDETTPFTTRLMVEPRATLGLRLQQNPRDLIPNTGVVLSSSATLEAWSETAARHALITEARVYLPWLRAINGGLALEGGLLTQNRGGIYDLDTFVPRAFSERLFLGSGTFVRLGAEYVQPFAFIDDGFSLFPLYFEALYGYAFGQTLRGVGDASFFAQALPQPIAQAHSVGGGLGLEFRFFYVFNIDLRLGVAYRSTDQDYSFVGR
ncbi:TolB-like translocation protein [Salisaeta longa]|uniref:PD40 domain-containing protein n=1 Tax=Salisaeta longa TaxID=503170 RepID=UPI0003B627AF|nr:PD40 domain-containing protein [Salisaeta longa]